MAKYNPFFEKAGMTKVNYNIDRPSLEKNIGKFLNDHDFDFNFLKSRTYCSNFFSQLNDKDKQILVEYLTDFANQPFIKTRNICPNLLTKMFSLEPTYLYWINEKKKKKGNSCSITYRE